MKILVIRYKDLQLKDMMLYSEEHTEQIKSIANDIEVNVVSAIQADVDTYLADTDVLIYSPYDHRDLIDFDKAKNLKWVHIMSAGATDIAARLKDTSILLTNSSGVHPINIAEHVLTFMLMFGRQMQRSFRNQVEQKRWVQDDIAVNLTELYQSTVAIIGLGNIGKRVAKLCKGFDMRVIALSRSPQTQVDPNIDKFYGSDELPTLLGEADFVVDCLPQTVETANFFRIEQFKQMKPKAYFINIGRGKTVLQSDLITALTTNVIAGAGLDVFEQEPLPADSELWGLKNVILTPHTAGWTPRYIDRVVSIFCANLKAYLANTPMPTLVDKQKGY